MDRQRRWFAALLCVALALAMVVSAACVAHEAAHGHNCTGKDCPVCAAIAQMARLRRALGEALLALLSALLALSAVRRFHALGGLEPAPAGTLVSFKIRLND